MDSKAKIRNIWACKICRCRFRSIPYISCPYTVKWVCGCKNKSRLEIEAIENEIYLTKEELSYPKGWGRGLGGS